MTAETLRKCQLGGPIHPMIDRGRMACAALRLSEREVVKANKRELSS